MTAAASCGKAPAEETETSAETTETTTVETTETEAPTEEILAPIIVETEPPFIPFTLHDRSIDEANDENFISLLTHLVTAYENPTEEDDWRIYNDLENIQAVSQEDYELANFIVDNWCEVFLYMDYNVNTYPDEVPAEIPNSSDHALVILGYELENGQMSEDLMRRRRLPRHARRRSSYAPAARRVRTTGKAILRRVLCGIISSMNAGSIRREYLLTSVR